MDNSITHFDETSDQRKQRIREVCATLKAKPLNLSVAMLDLTSHWMLVDDKRKALYCTISKGGSTTMKYLLLNATGLQWETGMKVHNRVLLKQRGLRYLETYPAHEAAQKLKTYYKYMVARDPFDRLVSTHRDKFLQKDERCYRNRIGGEIKRLFRPRRANMTKDVLFSEFVKYVASLSNPLTFDRHWVPQYFVCDPCTIEYDYIAKVESLERDAQAIFNTLDIPWNDTASKNSHGQGKNGSSLAEQYAATSDDDLRKLSEIYRLDMELFGYREPWLERRLHR